MNMTVIKCQLSDLNYIDINNGGSTKKKTAKKKTDTHFFSTINKIQLTVLKCQNNFCQNF